MHRVADHICGALLTLKHMKAYEGRPVILGTTKAPRGLLSQKMRRISTIRAPARDQVSADCGLHLGVVHRHKNGVAV